MTYFFPENLKHSLNDSDINKTKIMMMSQDQHWVVSYVQQNKIDKTYKDVINLAKWIQSMTVKILVSINQVFM